MKITSCDCYNVELCLGTDFIEVKLVDDRKKEYSVERILPYENEIETLMAYGKYCQHCGKKIEVLNENNS